MNKTTKSPKPNQSFMSTTPNPVSSTKKQFPSISLSKQQNDYKAYRSIDNKKKYPDTDKNNSYMLSPDEKSILMNRNMEMPSIHNANEMSSIDGLGEGRIHKFQYKILKSLTEMKRIKKEEEWRLYITKSELMNEKSHQFQQIEEYLLKFISKCMDKTLVQNNNNNTNDITNGNRQSESQRQNQRMGHQETNERKLNKTSSSFLLSAPGMKGLNKKTIQPSLKVLKDQLNTLTSGNRDASFTEANKTAMNFRPQNSNNKTTLIQKLQSRYEQELNRMTFERGLLQKKLQLYQIRISHLQTRMKQENIPIESQATQISPFGIQPHITTKAHKPTPAQQLMMNNLINQNKYKSEAEFKKIQNETLIKELGMVKEYSFKLKIQNERLRTQIQDLYKQCQQCREFKKFRQLWLMQAEQTIGWKNMWKEKKDQTLKLINKIKILKEKNKQLLHSFNFSMVVNPDQQEDKQELQNIIKGFQEWLKVMSVPRVNCPILDPKSLMGEQGLKEHQFMPDPEHINYKLLRPNFFIFFQAYQKTIMMEKNILNTRPLESTFFVKIRAILDSMYNHFNSYGNYKYWTSFPEFVIGFLEKYQISFTTLKMELRKKPMPSQEKLTFLMNLFNKKLSNTWECDMFRSFILEEYTLDEIYFFLDCRNDLNGGMTLTHGFGTIDPVSYVKLHKALATAQRKLSPYENYIIERVKTILKSRKKQKNGQLFIDRHFVLKLLLEVYALQKTKSERIFEASFKTKSSNKKQTVSYSDYFGFMSKNFDFLTTVEICELYRQTYSLSSGKISHKAVHFVCQSKGLFIPLIWSKRLNMNMLEKSLNSDMILLDLQNNTRKMNGHLTEMGVQEVARLQNDLNYFLRQVDWYRNNRQLFYFKIQQIKMKILKANCMLDWQCSTYTPNELLSTDEIRQGILQIHSLVHQSDNSLRLLTRKKQEKQKAGRQITRNFKIRIQESMREFRRIDDEQLRKLKGQMDVEIKMRIKRDQQQAEEQKQQHQNEPPTQQKQKQVFVGNSFANVNDMLRIQLNERKTRQTKSNLVKDGVIDNQGEEGNNSLSVNENLNVGRRPSKLLTILESNEPIA